MSDTAGSTFFNRHNTETIQVTESLNEMAAQLLKPGEFVQVTDPEDGPFLLRRDMIDLVVPSDVVEAEKEAEEAKAA